MSVTFPDLIPSFPSWVPSSNIPHAVAEWAVEWGAVAVGGKWPIQGPIQGPIRAAGLAVGWALGSGCNMGSGRRLAG